MRELGQQRIGGAVLGRALRPSPDSRALRWQVVVSESPMSSRVTGTTSRKRSVYDITQLGSLAIIADARNYEAAMSYIFQRISGEMPVGNIT